MTALQLQCCHRSSTSSIDPTTRDMTTPQRQSYWFETKKQTSIYWSRCDELKCDTCRVGGGWCFGVGWGGESGRVERGGLPQARLLGQLSRILWSPAPFFPLWVPDTFCVSLCTCSSSCTPLHWLSSSHYSTQIGFHMCGVKITINYQKTRHYSNLLWNMLYLIKK